MNCDSNLIYELQSKMDSYESFLRKEELSEQTRRAYLSRLKGFAAFLSKCQLPQHYDSGKSLREIAQKFHDKLVADGAKASSINAGITAVYHYYNFLGYKVPPVNRDWVLKCDPRILSPEEQDRLILAINKQNSLRDRALVSLLLFTGIRIGECRELRLCDLEISAHTARINVSSRNRKRSVPVNTICRQLLLAWLIERVKRFDDADEQPLFPNKTGTFMTRAAIDEIVRKVGRAADLNICAQILRNTCLTRMLEHGNALELVAELGGQSKLEHVRRFRKLADPANSALERHLQSSLESPQFPGVTVSDSLINLDSNVFRR